MESARKIAEKLDATLVNMRFVKPLDEALVVSLASRHRAFVTIEENAIMGGAGSAVGRSARRRRLFNCRCCKLGIPDRFIEHGSRDTCLAAAGLDLAGLSESIDRWWAPQMMARLRSAQGA